MSCIDRHRVSETQLLSRLPMKLKSKNTPRYYRSKLLLKYTIKWTKNSYLDCKMTLHFKRELINVFYCQRKLIFSKLFLIPKILGKKPKATNENYAKFVIDISSRRLAFLRSNSNCFKV